MVHWDSGRLITYLGGSAVGVSGVTQQVKAGDVLQASERFTLLNYPIPFWGIQTSLAEVITIGGFFFVAARFFLDVKRDRKLKQQKEVGNERI